MLLKKDVYGDVNQILCRILTQYDLTLKKDLLNFIKDDDYNFKY